MDYAKMGTNIKNIRRERRITQENLAEKVNISNVFISQIESGVRKPSLETIYNIAKALNVSVSRLIGDMEAVKEEKKEDLLTREELLKIAPLLNYRDTQEMAEAFRTISFILSKL